MNQVNYSESKSFKKKKNPPNVKIIIMVTVREGARSSIGKICLFRTGTFYCLL